MSKVPKKITTGVNDFCRFFRNVIRDPIIDAAINNMKSAQVKERAIAALEKTIPEALYKEIDKSEINTSLRTVLKKAHVEQFLYTQLMNFDLAIVFPFVAQKLQLAILKMYEEYYMVKFKRYGLHEYLEALLKADIDKDGDIANVPIENSNGEPLDPSSTPNKNTAELDFGTKDEIED